MTYSKNRFLRKVLYLMAILLLNPSITSAQAPTNKPTGQAAAPLPKLRLATEKSIAFKVRDFCWGQVPNGEPNQEQLDYVADYAVQVQLPTHLRILDIASTHPSRSIKDNKGHMQGILEKRSYVGDGKQQMEWDAHTKTYSLFSAAHTLADPGKNVTSPYLISPDLLFTPDALNTLKFKADGTEVVNSKSVAVYRRFPPNQGETVIYVDLQTRLPVRISLFGFDRKGDRAEMARTDYSDWQFDVKFPPKTFDTTPPPGYVTMAEKLKAIQKTHPGQ